MQTSNYIILSIGQAGNQVAGRIWQTLCADHQLRTEDGRPEKARVPGNPGAFFRRQPGTVGDVWVPRAILADAEPAVLLDVRRQFGGLFHPASFVTGTAGAAGNFAAGYRGEAGLNLTDRILAQVERELDGGDSPGGIFLLHSLGGGTGSGVGCRVLEEIKRRHPNLPIMSLAVLPSPRISTAVTEPYNIVLALDVLRRHADACVFFENEALFAAAQAGWKIALPEMDDLNAVMAQVFAGLSAPMRYTDFLTVEISIRELTTNLVARPGQHFLLPAFAPLALPAGGKFPTHEAAELVANVFADQSFLAGTAPSQGHSISMAALFRGIREDRMEAEAALTQVKDRQSCVASIPTGVKTGWTGESGSAYAKSITVLSNSTAVAGVMERICQSFDKLWSRRAFATWYVEQGLSEEEISAMREGVGSLIRSYREQGGVKHASSGTAGFGSIFVEWSPDQTAASSNEAPVSESELSGAHGGKENLPPLLESGTEKPSAAEVEVALETLASARKYVSQNEKQLPRLVSELSAAAEMRLRQGDLSRAESLLREAANRLQDLPVPMPDLALKVTRTLGALHEKRGRLDMAIELYLQALDHAKAAGQWATTQGATLCLHLAATCRLVGDAFHAEEFSREAQSILTQLESTTMRPVFDFSQPPPDVRTVSLEESILAAAAGRTILPQPVLPLRTKMVSALNGEGVRETWQVVFHDLESNRAEEEAMTVLADGESLFRPDRASYPATFHRPDRAALSPE